MFVQYSNRGRETLVKAINAVASSAVVSANVREAKKKRSAMYIVLRRSKKKNETGRGKKKPIAIHNVASKQTNKSESSCVAPYLEKKKKMKIIVC